MKRLLIFCLSLVSLTACQKSKRWYVKDIDEADKWQLAESLSHGVRYHYQGSVAEQFHILEALKLDSSNGDFWREMGTARVKRGLADEMYYYYGKASQLKPDPWMGFRGYLYLYFYRDYPRAIADFNTLDSITGTIGNSQAQDHDYMRGLAYYGMKDYPQAIHFLTKYIDRISAEVGTEWVDVNAHLYLALSKRDNAPNSTKNKVIESLQQGLKLYPNYADFHYHLAWEYYHQSKWVLAAQHLEAAQTAYAEGFYHHRPYVEVLNQIYPEDFSELEKLLTAKRS